MDYESSIESYVSAMQAFKLYVVIFVCMHIGYVLITPPTCMKNKPSQIQDLGEDVESFACLKVE